MGKGLKYYWKFQAALILRFPHTGQSTWCSRLSLNLCLAQQCVQAVAGVTLWSLSGCAGGPVSGAKEGWKKNYRMREKDCRHPLFFPLYSCRCCEDLKPHAEGRLIRTHVYIFVLFWCCCTSLRDQLSSLLLRFTWVNQVIVFAENVKDITTLWSY